MFLSNKAIIKTIKLYSEPLLQEIIDELEEMLYLHKQCRNYFYSKYSGIGNYGALSFYDIRDELVHKRKDIMESFGLSQRAVKMELSEVVGNNKAMWSNVKVEVKKCIRNNDDLTNKDRNYLYYVLKADKLSRAILNGEEFEVPPGLAKIKTNRPVDQLNNLLCRYIRDCKPRISHSKLIRGFELDPQMYTLKDGELSFVGITKGKRITVKLTSDATYTSGNIRIILDRANRRLEVHRCVKVKSKTNDSKTIIGVDKGKHTLLSASSGNEYGIGIGEQFDELCVFVNERNKGRNRYHSMVREIDKKLACNCLSNEERKRLLDKKANIINKNLPNKTYTKQLNRLKASLESTINNAIREMIEVEKPSVIVLEDLTFEKADKSKGKAFNRKMSMWLKGYLDERIEYIASLYGVKVEHVSAAYTSKFCSCCGAKLMGRKGKHSEIAICPHCGEMDANINAARNILNRYGDTEISLYTPYKEIEKILLRRYEEKNAAIPA